MDVFVVALQALWRGQFPVVKYLDRRLHVDAYCTKMRNCVMVTSFRGQKS